MQSQNMRDWQGKMLGRYSLERLLGRGGMGDVWLASDTQLRRQVAIKLLPAVYVGDQQYRKAFMDEARTAAGLEHPHILPVHDFGEVQVNNDELVTYLVMPYITGGTLRDRLKSQQGPLEQQVAMRYLQQAAQAIDYAHSRNVLHRDVKPANMLLQQDWLLLSDFGIARVLNATQRSHTRSGAGTPEYMAPEQAQSKAEPASDLYSLAIIAYQLFTGVLPFRGSSPYEILMKQINEQPQPPSALVPSIPPGVQDAILRGLAKKPADRQPSCVALVDELEQGWIKGHATQVDPDATILAPWSKRPQELPRTMVADVPATPTPAPSVLPPTMAPQSGPQPYIPSTPQPSVPSTPFPTGQGQPPYPGYGYQAEASQGYQPYTVPAAQSFPGQGQPGDPYSMPGTGTMAGTGTAGAHKGGISRRQLLIGGIAGAAVVAGGGVVLANSLHLLPSVNTGSGTTLNGSTSPTPTATPTIVPGPQQLVLGVPVLSLTAHNAAVWTAVWDPSGQYLVSGDEKGRVILWDVGSALKKGGGFQTISQPLHSWSMSGNLYNNTISWAPDGRHFAVVISTEYNKIHVLDRVNYQETIYKDGSASSDTLSGPQFSYVSWSKNGDLAANLSFSKKVYLWQQGKSDVVAKTLAYNPTDSRINVGELAWVEDGSLLAGLTNNSNIVLWNVKTGKIEHVLESPDRTNQSVLVLREVIGVSPINTYQYISTDLDVLCLWDTRQQKPLQCLLGTDDKSALTPPKTNNSGFKWFPNVTGGTWSPNGRYIAAGYGRSNQIHIWDLQNLKAAQSKDNKRIQNMMFGSENGHQSAIVDLAWSPDGKYIASTSFDKTVIIWKVDGA